MPARRKRGTGGCDRGAHPGRLPAAAQPAAAHHARLRHARWQALQHAAGLCRLYRRESAALAGRAGRLPAIEAINDRKAALLYERIDRTDFYRGTAEPGSRSKMNVTFRLPSEELEQRFVEEAKQLVSSD